MTMSQAFPGTNALSRDILIRPSNSGDSEEIVSLLNRVYGAWGDMETWRWKYQHCPAGFRPPSMVAEADGRMVGHYGLLPLEAAWRGEPVRAAQPADAAVLPEYRRRGIMTSIAHRALDSAASADVSLIYAFPGLYSLSVNQRIGFQVVGFVPKLVCLLRPGQAARKGLERLPGDLRAYYRLRRQAVWDAETAQRLTRLRRSLIFLLSWAASPKLRPPTDGVGGALRRVHHFDEGFNRFYSLTAPHPNLGLLKNSPYLNWRYFGRPYVAYQVWAAHSGKTITGYMVLRRRGASVDICELEALPGQEKILQLLLEAAFDLARGWDSLALNAWMRPSHPAFKVMQQAGFVDRRRLHRLAQRFAPLAAEFYRVIVYAQHLPEIRKERLLSDAGDWSLSMGDSDLV
jgi:GNAT superfamily N-acetyltransferase